MIELDETQITAKAEAYADAKLVHFRPFIDAYRHAIINAYIDGYVAGKLSNNDKIQPFLTHDNITKE